jgi:hypothetical protein
MLMELIATYLHILKCHIVSCFPYCIGLAGARALDLMELLGGF